MRGAIELKTKTYIQISVIGSPSRPLLNFTSPIFHCLVHDLELLSKKVIFEGRYFFQEWWKPKRDSFDGGRGVPQL